MSISGTSPISYAQQLAAGLPIVSTSSGAANALNVPEQVAIGNQGYTVTSFRDYTQQLTQGLWQFNLSGVLQPTRTGVEPMAVSEKQQKAEAAAVSAAFDLMNAGRLDEARQSMNDLLKKNPTNAAAIHALGYVEMTAGNYDKAQQLFRKANAFDPTVGYDKDAENARILGGDDASALTRAVQMTHSADQRDDGIRILIELTKRNNGSAAANIALGDAMIAGGQRNDGLLQYNTAIDRATPTELKKLSATIDRLLQKNSQSAFLRQMQGRIQVNQGDYEKGLSTLQTAAQISGSDAAYAHDIARARVGIGRAALADGRISEAISQFEQAKQLAPLDRDTKLALADGYLARAEFNAGAGALKDAAADYDRIATLLGDSGSTELRQRAASGAFNVGRRLATARQASGGEIGDEVIAFQAAYNLDNDNTVYRDRLADTRVAIGDAQTAAGKLEDAANSYQRAYDLNHRSDTYKQKAIAGFTAWGDQLAQTYQYDDAVTAYRTAYRIDTTNTATKTKLASAYATRAADYVSQSKFKQAAQDYHEALLLFPDNATYQAGYDAYKAWDI